MYFVVVIMVLIICGLMWFFLANGIQAIQAAFNSQLSSEKFATVGNWNSFNLANAFINNIWLIGIIVCMVLGLMYYGYVEAQRRR